MTRESSSISETLKQAARQAGGESPSGCFPSAKKLTYLNSNDPAVIHQQAQTKDLKTDTKLKKMFAHWFIGILIGQLVVMNVVFILIGVGMLHFNDLTINLFMCGTMAEVFGIVAVMARYLFSKHV
ncbi:TPA: hypothetical protein JZG45_005366 [Escherichia coli]|nr:hypothetical protein [Escherichia coli]